MKIVKPSIEVTFYMPESGEGPEQAIEMAGRTCYKSEDRIDETSAPGFVRMIRNRGHHAMLEFGYATARIIGDRGLTHELVRHRLASFAQESTRYCNYSKGKFQSEITVIRQPGIPEEHQKLWKQMMFDAEQSYLDLLKLGVKPEHARSVLPIGLKAEIVIGANLREWRHIFRMRCASSAHPIIRGVMFKALRRFIEKMPEVYADLGDEFIPIRVGDVYESHGEALLVRVIEVHDPPESEPGKPGKYPYVVVEDVNSNSKNKIDLNVLGSKWTRVMLSNEPEVE